MYFRRTLEVLRGEGVNPVAAMEIFPRDRGLFCGIDEAVQLLESSGFRGEAWALAEGEWFGPKETALRLIGPYQEYALFETAILGILASCSAWATAASECVTAARGVPVISFGARHVHPKIADVMDYAAMVGGCAGASTPAGAALRHLEASGTMPHALILVLGDTVRAAQAFDRHVSPSIPRTVLVDTFKDEVEESIRVADALGPHLQGVRLDTPYERGGVSAELLVELRTKLDLAGHERVQIFVSGGLSPDKITRLLEGGARVDGFGVGSYISGARPIDFTGDIRELDGRPVAKRGRLPGRQKTERLKRVL